MKRGAPLKRTQLGPGKKALERGRSFAAEPKPLRQVSEKREAKNVAAGKPAKASSLSKGRGFAASPAQQEKARTMPCIVTGAEVLEGSIVDPMHLCPRSMGGCDHPDCTVSGRRDIHDAFDNGDLDLLPYLVPARHPDAYAREIVHALEHFDYSLTRLLHRLTGERHLPESEILRLAEAAA